jgi:hypothetical protein
MALPLCLLGFVASFALARWKLVAGLASVLTAGYLYGILRANYLSTFAHFIFDAAVLGFYLGLIGRKLPPAVRQRAEPMRRWMLLLIGWAVVMFLLPLQHPLIQLVGLRGNAFLIPFLLVGSWLQAREARLLALWLAALNLLALAFAGAEYFRGVPAFYPLNPATEIIYNSNDVAGYTAYRIPATFVTAHSYAGTMVITLPWLIGAWLQPGGRAWQRLLLAAAVGAALLGIFLSATRVNVVLVFLLLLLVMFSGQMRRQQWLAWLLVLGGIGYLVSSQERLQRFLSLGDTEQVVGRIEGSVNLNFLELAGKYPLGNGLGAGGTSIPYFLHYLITDPVIMENEYSRILLEQGWPGLLLWLGFIVWIVRRRPANRREPWYLGRHLLWYTCLASFGLGILGIGLLTAIPQSAIFFLGIGFLTTRVPVPIPRPGPGRAALPAEEQKLEPAVVGG